MICVYVRLSMCVSKWEKESRDMERVNESALAIKASVSVCVYTLSHSLWCPSLGRAIAFTHLTTHFAREKKAYA